MHPTLDSGDVEFVRDQMVSGVRQRVDSPDATLDYLSDSIAYAGSAVRAVTVRHGGVHCRGFPAPSCARTSATRW